MMMTLAGKGAVCVCMVSAVVGTSMRAGASTDSLEPAAAHALLSAIRQAAGAPVAPPAFKRLCVPCHGEKGQGNGPAAVAFNPPPANLTNHELISKQTDAELRAIITNGKGSMPSFGAVLEPEEIDTLISYIRKLSGGRADQGTVASDVTPIRFVVHAPFVDAAAVVAGDQGRDSPIRVVTAAGRRRSSLSVAVACTRTWRNTLTGADSPLFRSTLFRSMLVSLSEGPADGYDL